MFDQFQITALDIKKRNIYVYFYINIPKSRNLTLLSLPTPPEIWSKPQGQSI